MYFTWEKCVINNFIRYFESYFVPQVALLKSLEHTNVLQFIGVVYKGQTLNLIAGWYCFLQGPVV